MNPHEIRARMLISQSRFELAERELQRLLADDPDNATAHALLAYCLVERTAFCDATKSAERAVHLEPDNAITHFALAVVFKQRNRFDRSEQSIRVAIALDPHDTDFYSFLSEICFHQHRWQEALEAADQALRIDAEHVAATNLRAMSEAKLGRISGARSTIQRALQLDPDNAVTHANLGWTLLEQREARRAMHHFGEAPGSILNWLGRVRESCMLFAVSIWFTDSFWSMYCG